MNEPNPIFLTDLISELDTLLIELLKQLAPEDWSAQTTAPKWTVKDVGAHLLDGNLRTLSMLRDHYFGVTAPGSNSYEDVVQFLNKLNAEWVQAMKRLSPQVIITLLESSGKAYCEFLRTLPPFEKAAFSVAWAGEDTSQNWFHIAREYTEKWHHQQQIRLAVGKAETLLQTAWYFPYLDTSVRGLPYHYRNIKGESNDLIKIVFRGESDKIWYLAWHENQWKLLVNSDKAPSCEIIIKDKYAWRVFTKGIAKEEAIKHSQITGNQALGLHFFSMIAVMA